MGIATRLVEGTVGELRMFGVSVDSPGVMPRYAFLGQEKALFKRFTVAETLRMGQELNPRWDQAAAERIVRGDLARLSPRTSAA